MLGSALPPPRPASVPTPPQAVTEAVMDSIHALSGQERVDEYAITVKQRMRAEAGRPPAPPEPRSAV